MTAQLIALEGIDGAGKGTQAKRLVDSLQASGQRVTLLGFPRYSATFFGARVGEFLNGRFGALDQVPPFLASLLYAGDRFESKEVLTQALAEHDVVVLDRYVSSNIAHQAGKLEGAERKELRQWIEHVEYELYGLPRADQTILLDLPVQISRELISRKSQRDYTDREVDLQEEDTEYMARVRDMYRELANDDPTWKIVDVARSHQLRSVAEIGEEISQLVRDLRR